jgi:tetratricopeptide (TPR) repeat protein
MKLTKRDFLLLAVIIYFTFIGGTFYSQLYFYPRVINYLVVTALLGGWLLARLKMGLPRTALDLALGLYLLVNLISALLGQSPRFSLEEMWFTVIHILAFYLLVDLARRGWTPKLVWAFYMASAVVCLVGLAEFVAWYIGAPALATFAQGWLEIGGWRQPVPPTIYRLSMTLNGATPLSAYLALLTPPALGLILTLPSRDENRKALLFWLGLALPVQILTFSRAGILALIVSLTLMLIGWRWVSGRGWPRPDRFWRSLSRSSKALLLIGGLAIVGLGLFWLQTSFANRGHSTSFRLSLWQAALTIFLDQPVTGAGPGNFGRGLLRLNEAAYPRLQIASAHSIYFNTAAELGLIGLAAGAYLFWSVFQSWRQRWRPTVDRAGQIRLISCGAALAGLAAQTLVDTYAATPNMLVMLAVLAYIVADPHRLKPQFQDYRLKSRLRDEAAQLRYPAFLALAALLVYLVGFFWIARADFYLRQSFRQEAAGQLDEAIALAARSQALDPALTLRTFRLASLEAKLAGQTGRSEPIQAAVEHYRTGLAQEPILGVNSANLAGLLWQQGQRQEAIELLARTIAVEKEPLYLINLGYFYEQQRAWPEAAQAYGQALWLAPQLAGSEFWQASPARAGHWPDFVEAAALQLPVEDLAGRQAVRLRLALMRPDEKVVESLRDAVLATTDPELRAGLAHFYLDRGQPQPAANLFTAGPTDAYSYLVWGRLRLLEGAAEAEPLLKTAIFLGNREAYYYLGQLLEQQGDLQAAAAAYRRGLPARVISENIEVTIYGRLGGNDLAPQLLRFGPGQRQAQAPLALARLYEAGRDYEAAKQIYQFLLSEDPFFTIAQERLALLEKRPLP